MSAGSAMTDSKTKPPSLYQTQGDSLHCGRGPLARDAYSHRLYSSRHAALGLLRSGDSESVTDTKQIVASLGWGWRPVPNLPLQAKFTAQDGSATRTQQT